MLHRIMKVFYEDDYGDYYEDAASVMTSERHSAAKERKSPHDQARCEACQKGDCYQSVSAGSGSGLGHTVG